MTSRILLLIALSIPFLATDLSAQDEAAWDRDPRPKTFVTDFTWYRPNENARGDAEPASLACTRAAPRRAFGEIASSDYLSSEGYYADKYRRFKRHGVDGIAYLVSDAIPDSFAGGNLVSAASLAAERGLDLFAYYDLLVTSANQSGLFLCQPGNCKNTPTRRAVVDYNINTRPQLYAQIRDAFLDIADYLILPHLDAAMDPGSEAGGYVLLEDSNGELVLDEEGLPRPVIAIYVAREFSDKPANLSRLGQLMVEVTDAYRLRGLGKPALVLDVIFWATPTAENIDTPFDPEIVAAFGDHAVAVTWYSFYDAYRAGHFGITNDGARPPMDVWAKKLNQQYFATRDLLQEEEQDLMIWPGVSTQIDTRRAEHCRPRGTEVVYHLRSLDDWRTMLDRGLRHTWRPADLRPNGEAPLQTLLLVNNAGEWLEIGALDYTHADSTGQCSFPYNWCTGLLDVLTEADRYP